MNNIVSLSGGKDSTAMLLMMIERKEPIHSIIFFDTGWEFPQMHDHIDLLEKRIGRKIWRLHPRLPFEYWMLHKPIKARKRRKEVVGLLPKPKPEDFNDDFEYEGELMWWEKDPYEYKIVEKGEVHRIGNGWPSPSRRWCTREKVEQILYFQKSIPNAISCVGIAADEQHRIKGGKRYPLIEWDVTESEALQYCYDNGFNWGGLYEIFDRVSCFCCPLQRLSELRKVRKFFPDLWAKMLDWDARQPRHNGGFRDYTSVHDLEKRFTEEDRHMNLFPEMEEV